MRRAGAEHAEEQQQQQQLVVQGSAPLAKAPWLTRECVDMEDARWDSVASEEEPAVLDALRSECSADRAAWVPRHNLAALRLLSVDERADEAIELLLQALA